MLNVLIADSHPVARAGLAGPTSYAVGVTEYRGAIDDIRFFERALDQEEVRLLFEAEEP